MRKVETNITFMDLKNAYNKVDKMLCGSQHALEVIKSLYEGGKSWKNILIWIRIVGTE